MPIAVIESLDHEGRGVARVDGKAIFIDWALPGETVEYTVHRSRPTYEQAEAVRIIAPSAQRVTPRCPHFGVCGGCSMQHLDPVAQSAAKQRVLEDALRHIAKLKAEIIYPAIHGASWGYRHRARLSVRLAPMKGVLIGFHERRSSYVADMQSCAVLPPHVSALLPKLHELVATLSFPDRLAQIELAVSAAHTVFVFRNLKAFTASDEARLSDFAKAEGVQVWQQPGGTDSAQPLHPKGAPGLSYSLPEFDVELDFLPTDFTQVNVDINRLLIRRAIQLLDPQPGERIADLFCGLGNFSLPIARAGARVIGIEGSDSLVGRARANARHNALAGCTEFHAANLFETTEDSLAALGRLDKMLIDPPREGAIAVVRALSAQQMPARIVYVSCNPSTLARDAAVLTHEKGYVLRGAGIANMFPHTSHVESVALFERT